MPKKMSTKDFPLTIRFNRESIDFLRQTAEKLNIGKGELVRRSLAHFQFHLEAISKVLDDIEKAPEPQIIIRRAIDVFLKSREQFEKESQKDLEKQLKEIEGD